MSIEEEIARTLTRALMTGIPLTKPAWQSVPVDPCEPTGEMTNVVSTDVTPLRDHIAAALSPLLNRVRAEAAAKALREAAGSSQAKMFSPAVYVGPRRLKLGIGVREWLNACADAFEQNSEGNEA